MNAQYPVLGLVAGIIAGWILGKYLIKKRFAAIKRERIARKKARQKKLLDRFRIEVKNNTIRLKKEFKRLGISRQLAPIDLQFKHFDKRFYRISDKELIPALQDFYRSLVSLISANETFLNFIEKIIQPHEKLEDEVVALFYNSMAAAISQKIEKIIETGPILASILEGKILDM